MIEDTLKSAKSMMEKALSATQDEFAAIRTGRANTAMFDGIMVDYYGAPTPLKQLASFNITEARTVIVQPFDKSASQDIIRAIAEADLGVNPTDDGKTIRIVLPALTEERRKEYVKMAKTKAEEGRQSVRSLRRKAKDEFDSMSKNKQLGEDEIKRGEKELDSITKKFTDEIDKLLAAKESELMTI